MKITAKILSIFALLLALSVSAEEAGQEIRIYPTGEIYLIGAELVRKHANNFYTIRSWNLKWALPVDATDTKIKIESAYGAPIGLAEILEGHLLEIRGITKYQNFEHSIEPTLIKDLSVKTGESSFKNQPTPKKEMESLSFPPPLPKEGVGGGLTVSSAKLSIEKTGKLN